MIQEIKADLHIEGLLPKQTPCLTHSLMLVYSVYKHDVTYYHQTLSEEYKYLVKVKGTK